MTPNIDTGITDSKGAPIREGDRVHVHWLEDIGVTELDLEAIGTVRYKSDDITAAFFVQFDAPICRGVCEDGHYRCNRQMLIQADEGYSITFTRTNLTQTH